MMNYLRTGKLLTMYSSYLKAIITDNSLMLVPIDDHLLHRGHGVTSNLIVHNGHIHNLSQNISYIFNSALHLKIQPPLSESETCQVLKDLVASSQSPDVFIQIFLTAGAGNMTIIPTPGESIFYAVTWQLDSSLFESPINEFTLQFPISNKFQRQVQNSHYLVNVLCREHSISNGGRFGLLLNEFGNFVFCGFLLPVLVDKGKNVVFVKGENVFPLVEGVVGFVRELAGKGEVAGVEVRDVSLNEVYVAEEAFLIGQDFIVAMRAINGQVVWSGDEGQVTKSLKERLRVDYTNCEISPAVDYSTYANL